MGKKAIFLDRDDTLVHDPGYISNPDQIRLIAGATESLAQLRKMGFLLVIVTNQSGVARGFVTEEGLEKIHKKLKKMLAEDGALVDGLYYCPYHPEGTVEEYTQESDLRKPSPGMLLQAAEELDIDLSQSWMIGDSYRDVKAGKAAGCHTILVDVPGKVCEKKTTDPEPDRKAVNLREAVNIIRMYEFHQKARAVQKEPKAEDSNSLDQQAVQAPGAAENKNENAQTESQDHASMDSEASRKAQRVHTENSSESSIPTDLMTQIAEAPSKESTEEKTVLRKARTFRPVKIAQETPIEEQADNTDHLLKEILQHLKTDSRNKLYDDFSLFKLLAGMTQIVVVFCLIVSLWFWLSPKYTTEMVQIMNGYAIALQLLVIALIMMRSKE